MDTAKDARVLVLEDALRRLNEIISNRKLKFHIDYAQLNKSLQTAGSLIYEVKYSYLDSKALSELSPTQNLISAVQEIESVFRTAVKSTSFKPASLKEFWTFAELDYIFGIVNGFQRRLSDYNEDPAFAVDIIAVELSQIDSIEGSTNLSVCRCTDGTRRWQIVTNIQDLTPGTRLACASLPPVEMMGILSEAMFLGSEKLSETLQLGLLKEPPQSSLNQARAQVMQITKRMM